MKKFRYAFPKSAYLVFALIVAAAVIGIVFASLRLAEAAGYLSVYPAVDIATIVTFVLFLGLVCGDLFSAYYAFEEQSFLIARLFSKKRIPRDLVCKFVIDEASGLAALYFPSPEQPDAVAYVTVNLRRRDLEPFSEALRLFNPAVVIEINPIRKDGEEEK